MLHNLNLTITLVWISSHIGIAGSELADTHAGMANQKKKNDLEVNLEFQEAYSLFDKHILDLWLKNGILVPPGPSICS